MYLRFRFSYLPISTIYALGIHGRTKNLENFIFFSIFIEASTYNTNFGGHYLIFNRNRPAYWTLFYLYGDSNKSTIPTFNALAIFSKLSNVGEYFSVIMLLIVDFGMPVKFDNCRTDTFFSYITFVSNIFMTLVCNIFVFLFLINSLRRFNKKI